MFTASFLAGDFSGLSKSLTPALAVHPLSYEGQQRPQGTSFSLQTSCLPALWEIWTPNPKIVTQVPCTRSFHHIHMAICSNGNLDITLVYSVVPCIPDSAKQESHHTLRRGKTHKTPTPKIPSVSGTAPQKWLLKLKFQYHLGTCLFLTLKHNILIY